MRRIALALLFLPSVVLAQGVTCTDTITRLADPPDGGFRYATTVTCSQIIPSLLIGITGMAGTSPDGGIGACYYASTCTKYQTFACAPQGTYDVRPVYMIDGVNFLFGQSVDTVIVGPGAQLSVRFEQGQTPGYAKTFVDYYIPQQIYPHELLLYTYLASGPVVLSSGTLGSVGTWQVPQDLPNGFNITVTAGLCGSDVSGDVMTTVRIPGSIEFNITDQALETERRVLLSNVESGYPYPHYQSLGGQDSKVPMFVRTRDANGQLQSGTQVYLRVVDPPDTAPYMSVPSVPAGKQPHKNDNSGPLAMVAGNGITPFQNFAGVWQGVSGANGELDFTLTLQPGTAAGDNYQVEASFDQTFPSGATWKSGTLTAWKRVFVEKKKTLRNGIALDAESAAGNAVIHVATNHYEGNDGHHHISRGDRIVLVHAPALDRSNALRGWYREEHNVGDVTRDATGYLVTLGTGHGNNITPEPLQHDFGRDPSQPTRPELADWIADLSGGTLASVDYFDAPENLVSGSGNPFVEAFTEYIVLPDGPFGFVPMPHFGSYVQPTLQDFAEKWCLSGAGTAAAPNHQLLVIGDNDGTTTSDAGLTITRVTSQTSSFVWRGVIEDHVQSGQSNAGGDPNVWAAKTSAHELTHQWRTNSPFGLQDHCPQHTPTYNDPALLCLMAAYDADVQAQRTNGIARFHIITLPGGDVHSEYLEIRKRPDPFVP